MRFRPDLRKPAPLLAAAALALIGLVFGFRWWDRYVEDRLARWAVDELARRTDSTYRLTLSDLSFLPLSGSLSFDSMIVATDSGRNRRRKTPLPALAWRAHGCSVAGVDIPRLLFRRSFVARGLGCRHVFARIALVSRTPGKREATPASPGLAEPMKELARPLGLSSFRIAGVSFPALSVTLQRPGRRGPASVLLQQARFGASDLVLDLAADPGERRGLSADQARLVATRLVLRPDTLIEIAAAGLEADLTDSTLRLAGAEHEPSIPEAEWVRRVRVRRDRIHFALDSLQARGVDYRTFVATGDIGIRAVELGGARLDVLSDRRIAKGPPRRHRTPQQVAAAPGPAFRLDTLLVAGGSIVYREREPESERPGRVSFDSLRGTVLELHLPPRGKPLRIEASARLMNEGLLTARASVPLDAPDFRYELSGRLGPMRAAAFNRFLSENESFDFDDGRVEGITFRQTVRAGRATTTITPRYRDLSVEPTGEGGGVIGSVKRTVKEFMANAFAVHSRNPDEDGENLRTGRTVRRYDPTRSWIQFLWRCLRDGLMEAIEE
jgi:hypothetical protein